MAPRRYLHAGGSFGRVQAVVNWTLDITSWQRFDGWCCTKGIDPTELPAYRFYNLVIYHLMEGKTEEEEAAFMENLKTYDTIKHPLETLRLAIFATAKKIPVEPAYKSHKYVPSWWRGDTVNAKVAKTMMKSLPK